MEIEGLHGIPATNWQPVQQQLRARLSAIMRKQPTAQLQAEARKIIFMLEAIDSNQHENAKQLLDLMPHVTITAAGELVSLRPLEGLDGKFLDSFKKITGFVKKIADKVKGKAPAKTGGGKIKNFIDKVKSGGSSFQEKAKNFFDQVKPTINVDTTSSIKQDWWKWLLGFTATVGIAATGYKLATKK